MKIKKYVVQEMQEAIRLIKEDLGPDAVIVSSYPLPKKSLWDIFSPRQLEVTAAVDDVEISGRQERPSLTDKKDQLVPVSGDESGEINSFLPVEKEKHSYEFNNFLRLRELNMSYLENWRRRLMKMDVDEKILDLLFQNLQREIPEVSDLDPVEYAGLLIKRKIVSLLESVYNKEQSPAICFFVGPTGVGKTTTLAKMAIKSAIFEKRSIAMISIATRHPQAVEELRSLTQSTGTPVEAVTTTLELKTAVQNQINKEIILVDTEGIPSKNAGQMLKLKSFLDIIEQPKDVLLVLSCTTRNKDLYKIITDFQRLGFSRLIFTKLDETEVYGSLLNAVCYTGKSISHLSCGLNVPDDLCPVDSRKLAEIILKGAEEFNEQAFEINL